VKPPAPTVLRKGAVIRLADGKDADALSYLDVRFEDGHVERRLGPGEQRAAPGDSELVAWGEEVIDLQGELIIGELGMSYSGVSTAVLAEVPTEIVVERWARSS
jgi:hypothetical protein